VRWLLLILSRAYIFPNIGFTIATIDIGEVFRSQGVTWVGSVMTCFLVVAYIFVFFKHMQAVWRGQILMDGKDEDVYAHEKMGKLEQGEAAERREEAAASPVENSNVRQRVHGTAGQMEGDSVLEHNEDSVA
jgi:hypothetical protein